MQRESTRCVTTDEHGWTRIKPEKPQRTQRKCYDLIPCSPLPGLCPRRGAARGRFVMDNVVIETVCCGEISPLSLPHCMRPPCPSDIPPSKGDTAKPRGVFPSLTSPDISPPLSIAASGGEGKRRTAGCCTRLARGEVRMYYSPSPAHSNDHSLHHKPASGRQTFRNISRRRLNGWMTFSMNSRLRTRVSTELSCSFVSMRSRSCSSSIPPSATNART